MNNQFTSDAEETIDLAARLCLDFGYDTIGTEHVLLALLKIRGPGRTLLREEYDITNPGTVRAKIKEVVASSPARIEGTETQLSPVTEKAIEHATDFARGKGVTQVSTLELLYGIATERGMATRVLENLDINSDDLVGRINRFKAIKRQTRQPKCWKSPRKGTDLRRFITNEGFWINASGQTVLTENTLVEFKPGEPVHFYPTQEHHMNNPDALRLTKLLDSNKIPYGIEVGTKKTLPQY